MHETPEGADLRPTLLEVDVPHDGPQGEEFLDCGPVWATIEAERRFMFQMPPRESESAGHAG